MKAIIGIQHKSIVLPLQKEVLHVPDALASAGGLESDAPIRSRGMREAQMVSPAGPEARRLA